MTNGDIIKENFNPYKICSDKFMIKVYLTEEDYCYDNYIMLCHRGWWNAPYPYKIERR